MSISEAYDGDAEHGWANYGDATKIVTAKLALLAGARTVLTNDKLSSFTTTTQLPADGDLWDSVNTEFIHQRVGDVYTMRILLKVDGGGASDEFKIGIRVKGQAFDFIEDTVLLPLVPASELSIARSYLVFADADSVLNGLELAVTSESNTNLWNVFYMIAKVHKGR